MKRKESETIAPKQENKKGRVEDSINSSDLKTCDCCHGRNKLSLSAMPAMMVQSCSKCGKQTCGYCIMEVKGEARICSLCVGDMERCIHACCVRRMLKPRIVVLCCLVEETSYTSFAYKQVQAMTEYDWRMIKESLGNADLAYGFANDPDKFVGWKTVPGSWDERMDSFFEDYSVESLYVRWGYD